MTRSQPIERGDAGPIGAASPAPGGAPRRVWHRIAGLAVAVALLAGMMAVLVSRWQELPPGTLRVSVWTGGLAAALYLGHTVVLALLWLGVVRSLGGRLSAAEAVQIHCLTQLGKYVPGKVVLVVGKVCLAVRQRVAAALAALSAAYEQGFVLVSGALVVLVSALLAGLPMLRAYRLVLLAACLIGAACLHPRVVRLVLEGLSRLLPGQREWRVLSYEATAGLLLLYALAWVLNGAIFYLLARGLCDLPVRYLPDCIGIMVLGTILGYVALIVPAGLGVRDATISVMLSAYVPLPAAIAVSLVLRVVVTAVEALGVLLALALRGRCRRRAAARVVGEEAPFGPPPHGSHSTSAATRENA